MRKFVTFKSFKFTAMNPLSQVAPAPGCRIEWGAL